jgi:adenylate cyclase, class 2
MNIEYEATFTKINKDKMRKKLKQAGAILIRPEFLMKRHVYQPPIKIEEGWLRVRDEGDKITMALKIMEGKNITDQKELELTVENYENACKLLEAIGCFGKSYQETLREIWDYKNVEITIDTWPGLQPIVEVEGKNEKDVKEAAADLGFKWAEAIFWSADEIYERELGIPREIINNHTPEITFKNPPKPYKK